MAHTALERRLLPLTLLALPLTWAGCTTSSVNDLAERTAMAEAGLLYQPEDGKTFARYYTYYPEQQVYHNPWQDRYYWQNEEGDWQRTLMLPASIELDRSSSVIVELFTSRPWREHEKVLALHPPATHDTGEAFASVPTGE